MEQLQDYVKLIQCIDNLNKQKAQMLKDVDKIKKHQKKETNDRLLIVKQNVEQIPKIDLLIYEEFTSNKNPGAKRKRVFELDFSSDESDPDEYEPETNKQKKTRSSI
ncbi:hypothetical protein AKO1_012125 [Acrasis kona]|uniref:Uncharacterized protein n=1 Tax=Acrasis kona TaxID=1008807 RepID=A0AAW2ZBE5_9EUKA